MYENCIGSGHLIQTQGEAINYNIIKDQLRAWKKEYNIQEVLFDPWNCAAIAQELQQERFNMVEFRFNTANLSEPTKHLDALIRTKMFVYNGSPLLKWCIGNVVCKYDAADNVFPKKNDERLKIDPVIAIIMTIASWMQKKQEVSIYSTRGIRGV